MIPPNTVIPGSYDYGEVMRSVFIAIAASYAALDLAGRVTAAKGRHRLAWVGGGATAMGIGIWEMHFKGMLAFRLSVPVAYHLPTVLASLAVAILSAAVSLFAWSRPKIGRLEAISGSIVMGAGIAGLHYTAMAAMRMPATTRYSPPLVVLSILLAISFSLIALRLTFDLREEAKWTLTRRLGSSIVMGGAISAMHYTGMAAATFISSGPPNLSHSISISPLGDYAVVTITMIVLLAAVITSSVDRRTDAEVWRVNQKLEVHIEERTEELAVANKELKKLRDDLRLVVDTIPQQIWSGPADGTLDYCNERWRSETGLRLEEIQGEGWQRMLHPEDRARVLNAWRESVVHGTPYEQEERHQGADGNYRWFLSRGLPLRDAEGRIVRWYGTNTDIDDWKQSEEDLQRSRSDLENAFQKIKSLQDQLRVVIDTIPAIVWSKLPNGSADFFNWRFREYTGVSEQEGLGEGWKTAIHPEDRSKFDEQWYAGLSAGEPFEMEARLRRADGQYR
jgi:PAS domain S-box-containing protein